jgi:hypothetical protein
LSIPLNKLPCSEAYDTYLKDYFKYESAILNENGKVALKYSCLICLPEIKLVIAQKNPIRYLGNHVKSIHPQLLATFDEATIACMSSDRPNLPTRAPFVCPDCRQEFVSYVTLKSHWQHSHKIDIKSEGSVLCNLCGKTFIKKDAYKRHMWSEHKIGKPKGHECEICGKVIIGKEFCTSFCFAFTLGLYFLRNALTQTLY